jgi:hypothetical protein
MPGVPHLVDQHRLEVERADGLGVIGVEHRELVVRGVEQDVRAVDVPVESPMHTGVSATAPPIRFQPLWTKTMSLTRIPSEAQPVGASATPSATRSTSPTPRTTAAARARRRRAPLPW